MAKYINWLPIKVDYLKTGLPYAKLAAKYGISEDSVKRKAAKEKWALHRNNVDKAVEEKEVEAVVADIIDHKARHAKIAERMLDKVDEALLNTKLRIQSMKDLKEVAVAAVNIHRQALGLESEKPPPTPILILMQNSDGSHVDIQRVQ